MDPITAMTRRRFLVSGWPWRAVSYLLTASVPGVLGLSLLLTVLVIGGLLSAVLIGIPMLASVALAGVPMAAVERWRLRLIDPEPVEDPHRVPDETGPRRWLATRLKEAVTWRELSYALLLVTVLWPLDLALVVVTVVLPWALITAPMPVLIAGGHRELWPGVTISTPAQALAALPAGVVLLTGGAYLVTAVAAAQGGLTRMLLAPREEELGHRLAEVTRSRARLVNAFEAERRRIERDLHDGAQQRLVAVATGLGLALLDLPPGPAADQVVRAHEQVKLALTELRELIHGIYPQVLLTRGLAAAVGDAADRSAMPVDVDFGLEHRLPAATEATGYFVVCEALANIAKHSQATRAWIHGGLAGETLVLEIGDDGVGGADPTRGSGLTGLTDRVAVVGGTVTLSSPPGGPTLLRVELPCPQTDPFA